MVTWWTRNGYYPSQVDYGKTTALGMRQSPDDAGIPTQFHQVTLKELEAATPYYFGAAGFCVHLDPGLRSGKGWPSGSFQSYGILWQMTSDAYFSVDAFDGRIGNSMIEVIHDPVNMPADGSGYFDKGLQAAVCLPEVPPLLEVLGGSLVEEIPKLAKRFLYSERSSDFQNLFTVGKRESASTVLSQALEKFGPHGCISGFMQQPN